MKDNPRYLAIQILRKRQSTKEPVDSIMEQLLQEANLPDSRDNQLVMAMVYGVLRQQRLLDALVAHYSRHPIGKMKNLTLQALRLGLYQLCFMERIPDSAAVNETVKALRQARQPKWLISFVNGLLRNVARSADPLGQLDDKKLSPAQRYSHPDWLFQRWQARYGKERAAEICRLNNSRPPLVLRVNRRKMGRDEYLLMLTGGGLEASPGHYLPDTIVVHGFKGRISDLPGYDRGLFAVQDEGAQLITMMLAPCGPGSYLDACAGLGGKTMQLAAMLADDSNITAVEPNERRLELLKENSLRLGCEPGLFAGTLADFARDSTGVFNGILVDAPCSGLGVIRRQPDIRWNRQEEDFARYQKLQLELLGLAASLLEKDGVLVYATCSTEPEENQQVVFRFLADHPAFAVEAPPALPLAAGSLIGEDGFFQMLPSLGHDGFFAARLRFSGSGDGES